ncbi:hypothetical protein O1D41_003360 [Vibrio cholerae]|nr:hypothetical protein [Vibrio vulnificus]EGR0143973.1 hypothetical protein [Vibrio cholerae]EKF9814010.1 hypothetical protein [Vibrio cholerae]
MFFIDISYIIPFLNRLAQVVMLKKIIDIVKTLDLVYLSYKQDVDEIIGHKGELSDKVKSYWSSSWFWIAITILVMSASYALLGEAYAFYINYPISMAAIVIGCLSIQFILKLFVLRAKILGKKSLIAKCRRMLFRKLVVFTISKIKKEDRNVAIKLQQRRAHLLLIVNKVLLLSSFIVYAIVLLTNIFNPLGLDHQSILDLIAHDWLGGVFLSVYFSVFLAIEFKVELGEILLEILIEEDQTNANLKVGDTDFKIELKDELKVEISD